MPKPLAEGNSWIISGWNQGMPVGYTVYPPWVLTSSQAWSFASCRGLVNHPRWWTKKPGWDNMHYRYKHIVVWTHGFGEPSNLCLKSWIFIWKSPNLWGKLVMFATYNPTSSKHHRCIHIENSLEVAGSQWTSWGWVSCCTVDFHWGKRPI